MKNKRNSSQLIRFVIIGTLNALITALVVWIMMEILCFNYLWANVAGYIAALINNFFWSKYWVFAVGKGSFLRQSLLFLVSFAFAYCSQFLALLLMVEVLGLNEYVSQFFGLFVYGAVNFVLNKKITFVDKRIKNKLQ